MLAATLPTLVPFGPAPTAARPLIVPPDGGRSLRAFGQQLRVLLSSADTGGALTLFAGTTSAGGGPPLHVHRRDAEIIVVLDGALEFFAGSDERGAAEGEAWTRVAAGGAAFLPPGVPHAFRNAGSVPCRTLTIALPGGFDEFFAACGAVFAAAAPGTPPNVAAIRRAAEAHGIEFLAPLGPPRGA